MTALKEDRLWGPLLQRAAANWTHDEDKLRDIKIYLSQDNVIILPLLVQLQVIFFPLSIQVCVMSHVPTQIFGPAGSAASMHGHDCMCSNIFVDYATAQQAQTTMAGPKHICRHNFYLSRQCL